MMVGERGPTGDHGQDGRIGASGERGVTGLAGRAGAPGQRGAPGILNGKQLAVLLLFITFLNVVLLVRGELLHNQVDDLKTETRIACFHTNDVAQAAGHLELTREC